MTRTTPRGSRLHIGFFGRRNAGKSTLLNAVARQRVSIVADQPGTTTDPVTKAMELKPFGPVILMDTAGGDDTGELGALRVGKSRKMLDRTDLAVLVAEAGCWEAFEDELLAELRRRAIPTVVAFSKADQAVPDAAIVARLDGEGVPHVATALPDAAGTHAFRAGPEPPDIAELKRTLVALTPPELLEQPTVLGDLVPAGETALLVVPIDSGAPRGRLILPQVQAIRDLLDHACLALVCRESELAAALAAQRRPPALVVTDSQAFAEVASMVPVEVPLTSFSILFARLKGDLLRLALGTLAAERLRPGDPVLVAESCSHHPAGDDIGRVKIPRLLAGLVGGELDVTNRQGHDFPEDPGRYRLVIHCGACMTNRREVLTRLAACTDAGVPVTNYGMFIAHCLGILDRALAPFPEVRERWRAAREGRSSLAGA